MWQAKFDNDETLSEFNAEGQEVLFGKVLARLDDLESLSIVLGNKIFTVRMADGRFSRIINGAVNHFFAPGTDVMPLVNIRPIYFVRETVRLGTYTASVSSPPKVNFTALGFQANHNGRNIKRYLAILPDGTYTIKDE